MFDASFWINNFSGLLIGIITSIAFWWFFSRVLVPKIEFEKFISKVEAEETKSGVKYRLAFRNAGRRAIVDVEIIVRLSARQIHPVFPNNFTFYSIPLGYNRLPRMEPSKSCHRHITRLDVYKVDELTSSVFSDAISKQFEAIPEICQVLKAEGIEAKNFEENPYLLEHLMSLGNEASLQVFIFGYDEFSGARKLFGPQIYKVTDIKHRKFPKLSC